MGEAPPDDTSVVGKPPKAAWQAVGSEGMRAGRQVEWRLLGVSVPAGEAAPAGQRWQTGFGSALVGGRYQPADRGQRPEQPAAVCPVTGPPICRRQSWPMTRYRSGL